MEIFIEIAKPNPGTLKIPSMVEGIRRATLLSFPAVMVIFMPFTAVISASAGITLNMLTGN